MYSLLNEFQELADMKVRISRSTIAERVLNIVHSVFHTGL